MDNHGSPCTPIDSLPAELLAQEIFERFCDCNNFITNPSNRQLRAGCPSLTISQVSSKWRQLAFSNPKLWSNISVMLSVSAESLGGYGLFESRVGHAPKAYHLLLGMVLDLSKDHSLTIELCGPSRLEVWALEDLDACSHAMLMLLLQHSWRWESLTCNEEDAASIPVPQEGLRRLTHLDLNFTIEREMDVLPEWFSTACNLKSVELHEVNPIVLNLCWATVERTALTSVSHRLPPETIYQSLDYLSSQGAPLRYIKLDGLDEYGDIEAHKTSIAFPELETLVISGCFNLDWILAPRLQHLDVSMMYTPPSLSSLDLSNFSNFLTRSGAALVSMTIGSSFFDLPISQCVKVLRKNNSLIRLDLMGTRDQDIISKFCQCIQYDFFSDAPSRCFPKLSEINVNLWGKNYEVDENLVSVLEPLCSSTSPTLLRKFSMSMERFKSDRQATISLTPKIAERLALLQKGGLSLYWIPMPDPFSAIMT